MLSALSKNTPTRICHWNWETKRDAKLVNISSTIWISKDVFIVELTIIHSVSLIIITEIFLLVRNVNHAVYAMGKYLKTISLVVSVKLIFIKNVDSPLLTILILLINNTIWDGIVNHAFNAASATISSLIFKTDIHLKMIRSIVQIAVSNSKKRNIVLYARNFGPKNRTKIWFNALVWCGSIGIAILYWRMTSAMKNLNQVWWSNITDVETAGRELEGF